jgi:uncharacterized phage protein (TIGR01671 family)
MSRIIKFRVWDNLYKKWIKDKRIWAEPEGDAIFLKQHPQGHTFQQFSGFKDSNNKEIYEGDMVKNDENHITSIVCDIGKYTCGEVVMRDTAFKIIQKGIGATYMNEFITCSCCPCGLTVIGNIFENSELLEKL